MKKNSLLLSLLLLTLFSFSQKDFYTHPEWSKNAAIYEVNIRQYTPQGTFKAFEPSLLRLKAMGVDILWLMPIYPVGEKERKGTMGSYYAVKDCQKVNPEFGTLADFKHLVNKAHELGLKIILDWVAGYSAPDNALVKEHPDWYKYDSVTGKIIPPAPDRTDVLGFNYKNKDLWKYQIESMKYWLTETDVDGFRCDTAMMAPLQFWKEARIELDKVKKVFMLAEAESPQFNRSGFDMTCGWNLMGLMNDVAKGEKKAVAIEALVKKTDSLYNKNDYHLYFTTNHDENSWNGSEYERLDGGVKCFEVLCFTLPGMPLLYSGQESALNRRLQFFDKDTIPWDNYPLEAFYRALLKLKHSQPELWNGGAGGGIEFIKTGNPNVIAYTRTLGKEQIFVLLNLSKFPQKTLIDGGLFHGSYKDAFIGEEVKMSSASLSNFEPWEFRVMERE